MTNDKIILALNSGSSSLKLSLYQFEGGTLTKLAAGEAEEISQGGPVWLKRGQEKILDESKRFPDTGRATEFLLEAMFQNGFSKPNAVGYRIVHGGPKLRQHQLITPRVIEALQQAIPFAPLHLPPALQILQYVMQRFHAVSHVACFDTAFHTTMPEWATRFPLPPKFWEQGLMRYGFHGLSLESIVHSLGTDLPRRMIVAHLGNGCSVTAILDGASIETTMGLTPTAGVMMGTRSGDIDPGMILHLLREEHYSSDQLDKLLNHSAGLLGVSGMASDMRRLLEAANSSTAPALAVEMFCYQASKAIGAMAAALSGVDLIVFTAGIGEHAAVVRSKICARLGHLGAVLDEQANSGNARVISAKSGKCIVRVIPTDEDLQIARHAVSLSRRSS